ncbi:hypothetical protein ACFWZK_06710 [[Kitasatospora] papulosa]|uniref:hypothetical protein n=1 Tax=[Kitasatospora] papulosa TaxID=1464011 RepID=UPI0036C30AF5
MDVVAISALVVSGFGLVASGFAVAYSRQQAQAAKQQAQAAIQQVTAAQEQLQAAREQVDAANRQVEAAVRQVAIAERAHREAAEPYVVVDIRSRTPGSMLLVLVIENLGATMARNVRISVSPPLQSSLGADRVEAVNNILSRPISQLPPRGVLKYTLDTGSGLFGDANLPRVYNVSVDADGPYGPVDTLTYVIDLNVLKSSTLDREAIEWSAKVLADEAKKNTDTQKKQLRELVKLVRHFDSVGPDGTPNAE